MSKAPPFAFRHIARVFSHQGLDVGTATQSAFPGFRPTAKPAPSGPCGALEAALDHTLFWDTPSFRKPANGGEDAFTVDAVVAIQVLARRR